ncbi:polyamine aminopropyltransferase [uncultured Enterococcus sp.]|uniref:polyamine aminopropyltransferase n=1 Tax=uncultured Enterococcus sp. TaxID=167972 RepID=UPI0025D14474|nr:polyamine aminopropyltransferase [uncultured Enterococcus sp.]
MDLWLSDYHNEGVKLSIKVESQLYQERSEYQQIDIFESNEFGRMLTLDGQLITTDKDEFFYSEMMVHVAMATNSEIKKVLVLGGCDGGVLKELEKYDTITQIDVVELDERVIEVSKQYLAYSKQSFADSRVRLFIQDGLRYVRVTKEVYDLIIVDSADPFGINESLFTKEFYGNCYKALADNGILISQQANGFYQEDLEALAHIRRTVASVFPINEVYMTSVPSYAAGYLLFGFSSKQIDPLLDLDIASWSNKNITTHFYNPMIHQGAFYLPTYIKEFLEHETKY